MSYEFIYTDIIQKFINSNNNNNNCFREMYVTRPLSLYNSFPGAASEQPPEGPGSGILVVEDEAAEATAVRCWGLCKESRMYNLPFPQNRMMKLLYNAGRHTLRDDAYFIPVIGQPLSSNLYYVIKANGRHKGKTYTCSKEDDMSTCCLCTFVNDVEPSPFDHRDIYQQVEIICRKKEFHAKGVATDGIPQLFLRRKYWAAYTSVPRNYSLGEALGLNKTLRAKMPDMNFEISTKYSPSVDVGKWYCPFTFVKEGGRLKDQMKRSMFYEMSLQQFWEEIYTCDNYGSKGNIVEVGVGVIREMTLLNGNEVVQDNIGAVDGVIWFKPVNTIGNGLGLSLPIWERMRWEEGRGGWVESGEKVERVERAEVYEGESGWKRFGCYALVERFVLKRMDGSLALTYDFKHTNKIRVKWE